MFTRTSKAVSEILEHPDISDEEMVMTLAEHLSGGFQMPPKGRKTMANWMRKSGFWIQEEIPEDSDDITAEDVCVYQPGDVVLLTNWKHAVGVIGPEGRMYCPHRCEDSDWEDHISSVYRIIPAYREN